MRILVAEDERDLNNLIQKKLKSEGYTVDTCFDGQEALEYLTHTEYDGAILDITMPEKDGLAVVREIRSQGNQTPVIFLTARDAIEDRVAGLDSGASDYMIKPFSFSELLARLRVLTRKTFNVESNILEIADLKLDTATQKVTRAGKQIELSAKEYALLKYMLLNKDVVLSREQIENHVWNYDYEGASNVIDVYIRYLRKKIDDDYPVKLIQTVRGRGYVLREE